MTRYLANGALIISEGEGNHVKLPRRPWKPIPMTDLERFWANVQARVERQRERERRLLRLFWQWAPWCLLVLGSVLMVAVTR